MARLVGVTEVRLVVRAGVRAGVGAGVGAEARRGAATATTGRGGRDRLVNELLATHLPHVYRFALRFLRDHHAAEDVAHDCMLRAWRHRRKLRDARKARVWLLRITANLCRDRLRRNRHRVSRAAPLDDDPPAPSKRDGSTGGAGGGGGETAAAAEHREDIQRILHEMARLSPKRRRVLFLHAFEQLSHDEIAGVLKMSKGSVMTTLSQARAVLRKRLSDIDPKNNGRG